MEFLFEYGLFLAKAFTLVVAILVVVGFVVAMASRQKQRPGNLEFDSVSEVFDDLKRQAESVLLDKDALKEKQKSEKKDKKKKKDKEQDKKPNLFVINFEGGPMAKEVDSLRKEITAVLCVAQEGDEVLVNVESGGGVVHGYGLAASQLQRIKDKGLKLTISVDKVAASGGYMMACVADTIISAPFAIIGSIGVVAQLPNFNKVLKKNDVDFEMHTSGELKLVDKIQTSDDFLLQANESYKLYRLKYATKKTLAQKLGIAASEGVESTLNKLMTYAKSSWM